MLRKLGAYPRQNRLAVALRELGRIERTLFALEWLQNTEFHRRVQIGSNKGEAKNALARAVFFNRLGEMRDRSFENQRYRASGLTLVVAAIILWNTVYLSRAIDDLKAQGLPVDDNLLEHLIASRLGTYQSHGRLRLVRTHVWKAANLDLSDPFSFLNVRFFSFREVKRPCAVRRRRGNYSTFSLCYFSAPLLPNTQVRLAGRAHRPFVGEHRKSSGRQRDR